MNETLLDTIDNALQEVEVQMLLEFKRIRNIVSADRYANMDAGIQNALQSVIAELSDRLDGSGDASNLELTTERHDTLRARLVVLRQLLTGRLPTAYLEEAHHGLKMERHKLERAQHLEGAGTTPGGESADATRQGLLGSLKGLFGKPEPVHGEGARIRVTERENDPNDRVSVYLDDGIYKASRELAWVSQLIHERAGQEPPLPKGSAYFASRDPNRQAQAGRHIAQTPEQIARKLRDRKVAEGSSTFESRELSTTVSPTQAAPPIAAAPPPKKKAQPRPAPSGPIAQSPEEIRKKLEARQGQQAAGKAEFGAKDLSSTAPPRDLNPQFLSKRDSKHAEPEDKDTPPEDRPVTGKAEFGARDLSSTVAPHDLNPQFLSRRDEKDEAPAEDDPVPGGKAVFEARDPTPPKKA